ncbi:MAG: peptidylprolyl isomerase, partial [Pseudomonadota bacterium]
QGDESEKLLKWLNLGGLGRLRRALGEPFLHFALMAALLFGANRWLNPGAGLAGTRIEVGEADIERLRQLALKQYGAAHDPARLRELVRAYVREEVLVREALAAGLDRDDVVVRHRLVQKIEFLAQAGVRSPGEAELRAYYDAHLDAYLAPAETAFEQLYFSPERHGAQAQALAKDALRSLREGRQAKGDPSMLARSQPGQAQAQLARDFGAGFATALQDVAPGQWSGPLASALGWHVVRVGARQAARHEPFEAVRERVRADLGNEMLRQARERAYVQARARYRVTLAEPALEPVP